MNRRKFVVTGLLIAVIVILAQTGRAQDTASSGLKIIPGDGRIYLEWMGSDDPALSHYELYRSVLNGYIRLDKTVTSFTDTGLDNGITYYYALVVVDQKGNRREVAKRSPGTPIDLAPVSPVNVSASGRDQEVRLRWTPNQEYDLAYYLLYRNKTGTPPIRSSKPLATFTRTDSTYVDTGLTNETMYYYYLVAEDRSRNRSEPSMASTVPGFVPHGLVAAPGDQAAYLRWEPNREPGLSHYVLYRTETYKNVPAPEDSVARIAITDTMYTDTGLEYNKMYFYYLSIVDDRGYSNIYVDPVSAMPQDLAPLAPGGLTVTVAHREALLGWSLNPEPDVARYYLYRAGSSEGTVETEIPIAQMDKMQMAYSDPGLDGGTTYYYFLVAEDESGKQSVRSPQVSATIAVPRYKTRDLTFFLLAAQFFLIPLGIAF